MGFINIPLLPDSKADLVVVDYRIDNVLEENLKKEKLEIIKTTPCKELYEAINGHPDILLHHIGQDRIVLAPNIFDALYAVLTKKGFALTKGETWLARNYPGNIAYNVLRVGSLAFHNTKYTDKKILEEFEINNIKLIHVNQGYTKCSVCVLDSQTIITSDYKLSKIAEKNGIESLLIKPGGIELEKMNYGFIGGASGMISKDTLLFTGNLDNISDKNRILGFIEQKGIEVKILSKKQIVDIGSILPL